MLPILWQQHLVPNGEELSLDPQVGRRARVEAALDLSVQRRVDREGGDADDVQELRADRVLQLPLVVLVGEPPTAATAQSVTAARRQASLTLSRCQGRRLWAGSEPCC
jgi:hypothetical protein